jgi:hypothetical protein
MPLTTGCQPSLEAWLSLAVGTSPWDCTFPLSGISAFFVPVSSSQINSENEAPKTHAKSSAPQTLSVAPASQQLALQLPTGTGEQRVDTVTRPCAVNPKGQGLMSGSPDPQAEGK